MMTSSVGTGWPVGQTVKLNRILGSFAHSPSRSPGIVSASPILFLVSPYTAYQLVKMSRKSGLKRQRDEDTSVTSSSTSKDMNVITSDINLMDNELNEDTIEPNKWWSMYDRVENRREVLLNQLSPLYVPSKADLPSLDVSYDTLYDMLEKTLISHHNNACLLSGFSGSGKSSLIYSVISALQQKHALNNRHFVTVYLHGALFVNDTATLNEIIHQLSVDFEIDKPKEGSDFQTLLDFLYQMLATSRFVSTPIIFILDAFDEFARVGEKQTLLYNLCDLLQASRCQLAIVALTQRLDVFNMLEKRIQSRMFSRKLLFNHLPNVSLLNSVLKSRLHIRADSNIQMPTHPLTAVAVNHTPNTLELDTHSVAHSHNLAVDKLLEDASIKEAIEFQWELGKSVRWFLTAMVHTKTQSFQIYCSIHDSPSHTM